jgi:hypothetical protein
MNITAEEWISLEDEELTTESLVSRLLNQSPTMENFVKGLEDIEYLLTEAIEKSKQNIN